MVAMLSQHAPPTCNCGELMWIYVTALGQASWRCVQCRSEITWQVYLSMEVGQITGTNESGSTYATGMFLPPMPEPEPGEEPPTSTGATSSATPGQRHHA
eukprot:10988184-Heterocapsa_arctica.AAC.1